MVKFKKIKKNKKKLKHIKSKSLFALKTIEK